MKWLNPYQDRLLIFFSCLLLAGIFFIDSARSLASISMIGMALTAIMTLKTKGLKTKFIGRKDLLVLSGLFLFLLPSVFYSDNLDYFFERLQIQLPFLILPLAFIFFKPLSNRQFMLVYYFFLIGVFIISLDAFVNYVNNSEVINQMYLQSQVMPTIVSHHPTFSIMITFAIYVAYYLYKHQFYAFNKNERFVIATLGILLFTFLHIFSVRSGLLAIYVLILIEFYKFIFIKKQYKTGLLSLFFSLLIGFTTFLLSPTIRNKVENTRSDISSTENGKINNQSLGSRVASCRIAIAIADSTSWLMGSGLGDLQDLSDYMWTTKYPDVTKRIIPHNQFLFYLAATGIIGSLVFIFCLLLPLLYHSNYKHPLLSVHYIIMLIALMFEAFFQTQLGVAYSLIFILLPLNQTATWQND